MAKDTGYLACKISKQIGQGKQTKCSDPNETMCPDQCIGTHSLYQFEAQGEGPRGGDMILSQAGGNTKGSEDPR